jgi:hypothetical protein
MAIGATRVAIPFKMGRSSSVTTHVWDGVTYLVLTNPNTGTKLRWGVRDGYDVEDWTLTPLGFDGVENTDWENVSAIEL